MFYELFGKYECIMTSLILSNNLFFLILRRNKYFYVVILK